VTVKIRPIQTIEEYQATDQIQREVWGKVDLTIIPHHLQIILQKEGGLVLGAFERSPEDGKERLVGFTLGFVGLTSEGKVKHCSQMTGVLPAYQNRNVGYRLKLAQCEHVLAQGMDLITWTFDPLESRNARLNIHKLGATCNTYLRNLYGSMQDKLNAGLPSDRLQVDWHIASTHVADRLGDDWIGPSLTALQAAGVPILNPALPGGRLAGRARQSPPHPPQETLPIAGDRLLVQIPARFQAIKSADFDLALAWREHTRALFEAAFAAGYTVVDLLFENNQSYYLLKKEWMPR